MRDLRIVFLGSGGGRFVTLKQIRKTGGFYLELANSKIYVDPGPGALLNARRLRIPLEDLDILIVTHNHIDHVNDANILLEAMTHGCKVKRGTLITNTTVLKGYGSYDKYITSYHRSCVSNIVEISDEQELTLGNLRFSFVLLKHDEPLTFGFKIYSKESSFGYISDTEYFEELPRKFKDVEFLVMNCIANYGRRIPGHMNLQDAEKIIEATEAKKIVITHLGFTILRDNLALLERRLREKTGKDVVFARDFMKIEFPEKRGSHQTKLI